MSERKARRPSLLTQAEMESLGAVHLWLKRHRRRVVSLCERASTPWVALERRMEADGVRTKSGEPPSAHLIRMTWKLVLRNHEKRGQAQLSRTRRPGPNVEPPNRPGVNLRPVRRTPLDAGYTPSDDAPPTYPATHPEVHPHSPSPPGGKRTGAETRAEVERQLREMDGYEPPPPPRGRII